MCQPCSVSWRPRQPEPAWLTTGALLCISVGEERIFAGHSLREERKMTGAMKNLILPAKSTDSERLTLNQVTAHNLHLHFQSVIVAGCHALTACIASLY